MGQYYIAIILEGEKNPNDPSLEDGNTIKPEAIKLYMVSYRYWNGAKLMEHSYLDNNFVKQFEYHLTKDGMFYKSRAVWAGDYADNEPNLDTNLYHIADNNFPDKIYGSSETITKNYRYILNHDKKQYVDKKKYKVLHPLPLLIAEGNGRGGGDYRGPFKEDIGIWARDVISVDEEIPEGYEESDAGFNYDESSDKSDK